MKAILICAVLATTVLAAKQKLDASIFDDDSDFMKGFETGIMMRSKNGSVEDFGCTVPESNDTIFSSISDALNTMKGLIPSDNEIIKSAFDMVTEFTGSLQYFLAVMGDNDGGLDLYCRGMIFGLKGSGMLVRIANLIKLDKDAQTAVDTEAGSKKKGRRGKKKGGIFGAMKDMYDEVGGAVLQGIAENMMSGGDAAADGDL